jgi:hypothetical protein
MRLFYKKRLPRLYMEVIEEFYISFVLAKFGWCFAGTYLLITYLIGF